MSMKFQTRFSCSRGRWPRFYQASATSDTEAAWLIHVTATYFHKAIIVLQ